MELITNIAPATLNNRFFCAESHMSPGIAEVRLAMTAPAPNEISTAGSAQHSKVEVLPNKARLGQYRIPPIPFHNATPKAASSRRIAAMR